MKKYNVKKVLQDAIIKKQREKDKLDREINKLRDNLKFEQAKEELKITYTKIPELDIMISNQVFNGKTYEEILKLVPESSIATYDILFDLRKLTDIYPQFKDFWVFVPNSDKVSKNNNYVAGFFAVSGWAYLGCGGDPSSADPALGVFLYKKLGIKHHE